MNKQGEQIFFTLPEQLMGQLPESLHVDDAAPHVLALLGLEKVCERQAAAYAAKSDESQQMLAHGVRRKAGMLRRMSEELAEKGGVDIETLRTSLQEDPR